MRAIDATLRWTFKQMQTDRATPAAASSRSTRTEELRSFLFFTIVMAPLLAVMFVGGYGFLVWMYQLVAGPPAG